jgi:hypothetical protein
MNLTSGDNEQPDASFPLPQEDRPSGIVAFTAVDTQRLKLATGKTLK